MRQTQAFQCPGMLINAVHIGQTDIFFRYIRVRNYVFSPKPKNWMPHPFLFFTANTLSFSVLFLTPYTAGSSSFRNVLFGTKLLTFLPLAMPYAVPRSWGKVHSQPHEAYKSLADLFRFVGVLSAVFHAKSTVLGLVYNAPDAYYHRHSVLLPFDKERRSAWDRTSTSFGRILGATSDHPVIAAVGWDVVLSAFSAGLWATSRALDMSDILACTVPFYSQPHRGPGAVSLPKITHSHRKKPSTAGSETHEDGPTKTPRKRGRPRKIKAEPEEAAPDNDYKPTPAEVRDTAEGDVLPSGDLDWESAALTWGLVAFGGLGCGSAGVFGGECISR